MKGHSKQSENKQIIDKKKENKTDIQTKEKQKQKHTHEKKRDPRSSKKIRPDVATN